VRLFWNCSALLLVLALLPECQARLVNTISLHERLHPKDQFDSSLRRLGHVELHLESFGAVMASSPSRYFLTCLVRGTLLRSFSMHYLIPYQLRICWPTAHWAGCLVSKIDSILTTCQLYNWTWLNYQQLRTPGTDWSEHTGCCGVLCRTAKVAQRCLSKEELSHPRVEALQDDSRTVRP